MHHLFAGVGSDLRYVANDGNVALTQQGSLSVWVSLMHDCFTGVNWKNPIVSFGDGTDSNHLSVYTMNRRLYVEYRRNGASSTAQTVEYWSTSETNYWAAVEWHHLVLTWDFTGGAGTGVIELWKDGRKDATLSGLTAWDAEPAHLALGCGAPGSSLATKYMLGWLDGLGIWDEVATSEQITALRDRMERHLPRSGDIEGSLLFRAGFDSGSFDADYAVGTATATCSGAGNALVQVGGEETAGGEVRFLFGTEEGRYELNQVSTWDKDASHQTLDHEAKHAVITFEAGQTHGTVAFDMPNDRGYYSHGGGKGWVCRAKVWATGGLNDTDKYVRIGPFRIYANKVTDGSGAYTFALTASDRNTGAGNATGQTFGNDPERMYRFLTLEFGCYDAEYNGGGFLSVDSSAIKYAGAGNWTFAISTPGGFESDVTLRIEQFDVYREDCLRRTSRTKGLFVPVTRQRRGWVHRDNSAGYVSRDSTEWEFGGTELATFKPGGWQQCTWPPASAPEWMVSNAALQPYEVDSAGRMWAWARAQDSNGANWIARYYSDDLGLTWAEDTSLSGLPLNVTELLRSLGVDAMGYVSDADSYAIKPTPVWCHDGTYALVCDGYKQYDLDGHHAFSVTGLSASFGTERAEGPHILTHPSWGVDGELGNLDTAMMFQRNPYARSEAERYIGYGRMKTRTPAPGYQILRQGALGFSSNLTECRGARGHPHGFFPVHASCHAPTFMLRARDNVQLTGEFYGDNDLYWTSEGVVSSRVEADWLPYSDFEGSYSCAILTSVDYADTRYYFVSVQGGTYDGYVVGTIGVDRETALELAEGEVSGYSQTCAIGRPADGWRALRVNFGPGASGGTLRVAVLDAASHEELEGYGLGQCDLVTEDGTAVEVTWQGQDLSGLADQEELVFQFELSRSGSADETPRLYAWEVVGYSAPAITDLLVEGEPEPSNVRAAAPVMTWTFDDPQGQAQSAYRIMVASTAGNLAAGQYDLWDSGWVSSSEQSGVYAGEALEASEIYYVAVAVRNESGVESEAVETAFGMSDLVGSKSYCTADEVMELLQGFDLSSLGDADEIEERVELLLPVTKAQMDSLAGRDFEEHREAELEVDGTGHDCLFLFREGAWPLEGVSSLAVDGEEVPAEDYAVYGRAGYVRLRPSATWGTKFPAGVRNVRVTATWGYTTPPAEVSAAQAKLAASQLLARASAADSGGAVSKRIGDYAVTYAAGGPQAAAIESWLADVEAAAARYRAMRASAV